MSPKAVATEPTQSNGSLGPQEQSAARKGITRGDQAQRSIRGDIPSGMSRLRKAGRRIQLAGVWSTEAAGTGWRRLKDPRRKLGRNGRKLLLLHPLETFSIWLLVWAVVAIGCGYFLFHISSDDKALQWLAGWGLGASFAAFVAVIWQDGIKSPHTARRIRSRIIDDPAGLLRPTLAEQRTKIIELDPSLDMAPREDLSEELLPGILARKKKDVQIIVGAPGAGKTTALLDLAAVLTRIGFVPVLLDLRDDTSGKDLFELAKERFQRQIRPLVKTSAEADIVWRWLCRRQRVAILVDDIDQLGFDGEPGFVMRRLLEEVASEGQAVVVTARPAGVPVGIAASAVTMEPLAFDTALNLVAQPALQQPGATGSRKAPRARIERWIQAGELTEVPLYLEALAELTAAGVCPDLPDDPQPWTRTSRPGRSRKVSNQSWKWNPVWVRYMLLDRFRDRIVDGSVRRGLAIDNPDRERSMRALERAALGTLGATALEAEAAASYQGNPKALQRNLPKRTAIVDFLSSDDRQDFESKPVNSKVVKRRTEVSQHEAIDTGVRLRVLEERYGELQFRHRIMQAFLAGRCLAKLGIDEKKNEAWTFEKWVGVLMAPHHPEKLTAHLALIFAALYADELCLAQKTKRKNGRNRKKTRKPPGRRIAEMLFRSARKTAAESGQTAGGLADQLDPSQAAEPPDRPRRDPDDELIKLATATTILGLLRENDDPEEGDSLPGELLTWVMPYEEQPSPGQPIGPTVGAMRWTKLRMLKPVAELNTTLSWRVVWEFTRDLDYDIRHAASRLLEQNASRAYPLLKDDVEVRILQAGARAEAGLPLQSVNGQDSPGWNADAMRNFIALGWVLPAIVSGLSEERRSEPDEGCLDHARLRLEEVCRLAYGTQRHELEESLAQGFKADAMRHADPSCGFGGPGWVAHNRRLVARIALPRAESWYARMLLYQALALYAIAGGNKNGSFDWTFQRLRPSLEPHPLARETAKLSRAALNRAQLKRERWTAFIWGDEVEDACRLPAFLDRRTAQLVGDVAVLVDLKEGSPPARHANFGHMEELPYCLSASSDRHEILGSGCPEQCGWGFCPYRAASPDEPNEHRGISRGFCRGERRKVGRRSPPWQHSIRRGRLADYWEQMEYKARR